MQSPLSLRIYIRNHRRVVGANQYMCCSSCGWKSFRAKKTASSSRRFMCHRLWDSSYSPEAGIPSHTTPQPWVMHPSWSSRATLPSTGEIPGWRDLGCIRASMWPRCANIPKSTPFTGLEIPAIAAAGACVIIPDVIPLNPPPWVRAVSEIPSTEQSCLAWKGAGKTIGRGSISREAGFHLHAISREAGSHPHAISREAGSHPHAISREAGSHPHAISRERECSLHVET